MKKKLTTTIQRPTIASDGNKTIVKHELTVEFENENDLNNYLGILKEMQAEEDAEMSMYILMSMAAAGVTYQIFP